MLIHPSMVTHWEGIIKTFKANNSHGVFDGMILQRVRDFKITILKRSGTPCAE
jgi:hypothetical protein